METSAAGTAAPPRPASAAPRPPEPKATAAPAVGPRPRKLVEQLTQVNKELWLILSMMALLAIMNYLAVGQRFVLGLYALPTLYSAYHMGRRHAVLTAVASIALIGLTALLKPGLLGGDSMAGFLGDGVWYDFAAWGGILIVTAYAMGTLHDRHRARILELHETYRGLLLILRQFIARDKYTENHCYRVSVYAARIGGRLGLDPERVEDLQSAALLHDIGKLEVSRELLHKAARMSNDEYEEMKRHVSHAEIMLAPVSGPLHRILPIILAHHERHDGTGYRGLGGEDIPLEARIIAVADAYDAMVSDRPYRQAISSYEAKEIIEKEAGSEFDPHVVRAFVEAFQRGELEVPGIVV